MAILDKIEFINLPDMRMIGIMVVNGGGENPVPELWNQCFKEDTFKVLHEFTPVVDNYIGWMGEYNKDTNTFTYIAGMLFPIETPVPNGFAYRDLKSCKVGNGYINGEFNNGEIFMHSHELTVNGILNNGHEPDYSFGWSAEVYARDLSFEAEEGTIQYFCPCRLQREIDRIVIKPLCKDLHQDYLDFFDTRAFSDGHPNGPCYCTSPTMTREVEKKMVSEFGDDIKGTIRKYAVDMLNNEMINGYLAFDKAVSVAWCNAADMQSYVSFVPQLAIENSCGRTISIVCFEVAPEYRNKGIALALIHRICSDAKKNGYIAVEGYVTINDGSIYDFTGPKGLYEKAGFSEVIRNEEKIVMRLML